MTTRAFTATATAVLLGAGTLAIPAGPSASAVAASPAASRVTAAGDVRGVVARVVDGDTLHVTVGSRVHKVRVIGVDTPEMPRGCYAAQATAATRTLVAGRTVILRADRTQPNTDRYGRLLRHVVLTDGTTLAQRLISNGFGREMTVGNAYAGRSTYLTAQKRAQAKKRGLWGACGATAARRPGTTTPPAPKTSTTTTASCTIKGNISSSGEKIYHLPGQKYYAVTKIDLGKGERWFCSTRDAVRAGWRPAKV